MVFKEIDVCYWKMNSIKLESENTHQRYEVIFSHPMLKDCAPVRVVETSDELVLVEWIKARFSSRVDKKAIPKPTILGFSCKPCKSDKLISRISFCSEDSMLIYKLSDNQIPDAIIDLFKSKNMNFVGINMVSDHLKDIVRENYGFDGLKGASFDYMMIQEVKVAENCAEKQVVVSLKEFVKSEEKKLKKLSCQWSAEALPVHYVQFAALEGFAGLKLHN
ncbi:hypothetical protein MKW92_044597 [Papaver armeniacum]|nr:hypothetical protein MKW92_044597 [Papaver armeniacum]